MSTASPATGGHPLVFHEANDVRAFSREQRKQGKSIGFVPTMGCLHAGHISLVNAARQERDVVIVSIYVNPTQFSANEDFGVYPKSTEQDLALLQAAGVDAVYMPRTMYHAGSSSAGPADDGAMVVGAAGDKGPDAHSTWVQVERLNEGLCSVSRPTFFRGVTTVVTKLFNTVEPDAAYFGKKDYQQWRILERMARDLDFAIEIVGMPIQREEDGLAMSSRNLLLRPEHRAAAPAIYATLCALREAARGPEAGRVTPTTLHDQLAAAVTDAGGRVDYAQVVDARLLTRLSDTLPATEWPPLALAAVAVHFGSVRLIDNIEIERSRA